MKVLSLWILHLVSASSINIYVVLTPLTSPLIGYLQNIVSLITFTLFQGMFFETHIARYKYRSYRVWNYNKEQN